jgi:hypothetical protein
MNGILESLAFVLVIGGQFLAAVFLISRRESIYSDPRGANTKARAAGEGDETRSRGSDFSGIGGVDRGSFANSLLHRTLHRT